MKTSPEVLATAAASYDTPLYVYEQETIENTCKKLKRHFSNVGFHYAMKANSNPTILSVIRKQGMGVEAVSLGELALAAECGFLPANTSFTCSNLAEKELVAAAKSGARVHLDSLHQLETWGRLSLGRDVSLRLNQGIGGGHHAHVITGGPDSKFGIGLEDLPAAHKLSEKYNLRITGIQQHIGSNVLDAALFMKAVRVLLTTAATLPDLTHIDFGGGIGVPYKPEERELNLALLGKEFRLAITAFQKTCGRKISCAMEPGRYLVADAGKLLVSVVDSKETSKHTFVGVNAGFNQLIRPAMYGSYHPITNLSRKGGTRVPVTIAGNVCESGDVFAVDRLMQRPKLGDLLAIEKAGAYGFSMASTYNLHALPREVLITSTGKARDISFNPTLFAR